MLEQSTQNAVEGAKLSTGANQTAQDGASEIEKLADTMEKINENSEEIANAIDMIDEIAFQTNLLALNAAVEAANAGEHGAGFAVVADEVRQLAQRSAEAAKEIGGTIEANTDMTEEGTELSGKAREVLEDISGGVATVAERVREISAASEEQSRGIEEINKAVTELEAVTEENTAQAEETASSSDELASQAASLEKMVDNLSTVAKQFRIEEVDSAVTQASKKPVSQAPSSSVNKSEDSNMNQEEVLPLSDDIAEFK
jgi:methyl-accepting chemotaxis protein